MCRAAIAIRVEFAELVAASIQISLFVTNMAAQVFESGKSC